MKINLERILSKYSYILLSTILGLNLTFPPNSYAHKDLVLNKSGNYTLDVYADYLPPYQNIKQTYQKNNQHPGLVIEILEQLDKLIDSDFRYHLNTPRKRALEEIIHIDGKGEIFAPGVKTKEREKNLIFSVIPISKITWEIYTFPETKVDFKHAKSVILPLGYAAPEELTRGKKILTPISEEEAIKMLEARRAEYLISPKEIFTQFKKEKKIIQIPNINISQNFYLAYDKNTPKEIIDNINRALITLLNFGVIKGINAKYGIDYDIPKLEK